MYAISNPALFNCSVLSHSSELPIQLLIDIITYVLPAACCSQIITSPTSQEVASCGLVALQIVEKKHSCIYVVADTRSLRRRVDNNVWATSCGQQRVDARGIHLLFKHE